MLEGRTFKIQIRCGNFTLIKKCRNQLKRKVQLSNSVVYTSRMKREIQSGGNYIPSNERFDNTVNNVITNYNF